MKRIILPFCLLMIGFFSFANSIEPFQSTTLFTHMIEINKEWLNKSEILDNQELINFKNDQDRIRKHLNLVEAYLRSHTPSGLSSQQSQNRKSALDILKQYYENNCFPINYYHSTRQPYFIDDHKTACAVGHLIIETGFKDLAQKIEQENNYAYLDELASQYPDIQKWADVFGFTMDELSWVQPTYSPMAQHWNDVGNGGGSNGIIKIMKAFQDQMLYIGGDFTEIDGVEANSIAAWDGANWHTLGEGVTGIIHDIDFDGSGVYLAGNFYVNENPEIVNLAYWSDGSWEGLEVPEMTGAIFTIRSGGEILIGGTFNISIDSTTSIKYLAKVKKSDWSISNDNNAFSVDAAVLDFDYYSGNLLVAGNFTKTAFFSTDQSLNHLEVDHLAYYNNSENDWSLGFHHNTGRIKVVDIDDGYLVAGGSSGLVSPRIGIYGAGIWNYVYLNRLDSDQSTGVLGMVEHNNMKIYYGNIFYIPFIGTISKGILVFNQVTGEEGGSFNAPVTTAESFQGQLYFAGDFTTVQGLEFPGLVSSPFDGVTNTSELENNTRLNIYSSSTQVHIQYEQLQEDFEITFYNLNGQQLSNTHLPQGSGEVDVTTQNWSSGIYVYQAVSLSGQVVSGKVFVK